MLKFISIDHVFLHWRTDVYRRRMFRRACRMNWTWIARNKTQSTRCCHCDRVLIPIFSIKYPRFAAGSNATGEGRDVETSHLVNPIREESMPLQFKTDNNNKKFQKNLVFLEHSTWVCFPLASGNCFHLVERSGRIYSWLTTRHTSSIYLSSSTVCVQPWPSTYRTGTD